MNRTIILSLLLLFTTLGALAQSEADQIVGTWADDEGSSHIEIFKNDGKYFGKIVWLKEPNKPDGTPKTDIRNSDPDLRDRPIMDLVLISNLEYRQGKWSKGSIYGPRRGGTADCSLVLVDHDKLELTVSKSFYSTTKIWTRI